MMKTNKGSKNFGIRTIASYVFAICAVLILTVASAQAALITVTSDADSGPGTLRQAILDANGTPGVNDSIDFAIPGGGVRTINLLSPLPAITDNLLINGYTQPGSSVNTLAVGSNAVLTVELNGAGAGAAIGLRCSTSGGSTCIISGLVINRFQEGGIRFDAGSRGTVQGNFIGTNAAGTAALGNINYGVLLLDLLRVNSTCSNENRNVISGNSGTGITIANPAFNSLVCNNLIGTDKTGTIDLGNTSHGILVANASSNFIQNNVISGNNGSGVAILTDFGFTASNNQVRGNFIGIAAGGNTALGNNGSGVVVQASGNAIGGSGPGFRNVISGNGANGVSLSTNFATGNFVQANYIGVGANGTTAIPNNNNGIQISNNAASNTIGGTTSLTVGSCTGVCNIIANNGEATSQSARAGVYVDPTSGAGNRIRGNSIFNNFGIGIDLHISGSTANDAGDPDMGANNQQNFPVVTAADTNGNVTGTLNSTPNATFAIDFYSNTAADAANSEGRTFIGSTTVLTNGSGNASFNFGTTATLTAGQFITATATSTGGAAQAIGDTSEFSASQAVVTATGGGAAGFEADIAPRPNGDTNILSDDVVQIRRFLNGTDAPSTVPNEFQRADSAPIGTRGDGAIDTTDVVQTRRYQNGTDAKQPAGGPTMPGGARQSSTDEFNKTTSELQSPEGNPREVRVESASGSAGQMVTVNIRVNAVGNESEYGFIISYDSSVLSMPVIGAGNAGASVRSCNIATAGTINCSVGGFPNNNPTSSDPGIGEIAAGNNQILITVTFTIAANATPGTTSLTLSNVNASSDTPQLFTPTATNGTVTILAPTAANVSLSGRVSNGQGKAVAKAQLTMTNSQGEKFYARSSSFGYFKFTDVQAGETYIITVKSKQYTFAPQVVNAGQDVTDIIFIAEPK